MTRPVCPARSVPDRLARTFASGAWKQGATVQKHMAGWTSRCYTARMTLKQQILLTPAVMIALLSALVWFTLSHHAEMQAQNEIIRQWGRITDRMHLAKNAALHLGEIAEALQKPGDTPVEDLHFNYLEQYRILSGNLDCPACLDYISAETQNYLKAAESALAFKDNLDAAAVSAVLKGLHERLENLQQSFFARKRSAYVDYYAYLESSGPRLVHVLLSGLVFCVLLGAALSYRTIAVTRRRLAVLAGQARQICAGELSTVTPPPAIRDEVDELADCLAQMTQRLINVVAADKVIEGAEHERKRIAMDLHDQILSALTALARQIEKREALPQLLATLEETGHDIRRIIDDLHPATLDVLGLEEALRSHLQKNAGGADMPRYYFSFDAALHGCLNAYQSLCLYRITLEAVANVLRHAGCSQYEISFRHLQDKLVLSVEDNGKGFVCDDPVAAQGRGIGNILERAKSLHAEVHWGASRFSGGCCFSLSLPLACAE